MHKPWLVVAMSFLADARAQFDQMPKKPKPAPLNKDIPYIKCRARHARPLKSRAHAPVPAQVLPDGRLLMKDGRIRKP